jgi:ribonuclease VapC
MYLDASAIISILANEDDAGYLLAKIEMSIKPIMYSSLTAYEAVVSLARVYTEDRIGSNKPIPKEFLDDAQEAVEQFLSLINARDISISGTTHRKALAANREYGKVVASPARLNLGDCFVYALAKEYRLPLLFKGDDFTKTDIEPA